MKQTIVIILTGFGLFAAGNFAAAQSMGDGVSNNQGPQYAAKSIHHYIMNLKKADEHGLTDRGSGFFIDSTSLDTYDVHDCGDKIQIVTTRDATLYTTKNDSSIEFDIEKRLEEYGEVEIVSIYPKLFDRDITANVAIFDLTPQALAWFKSIPERVRPKCIGFGTRGNEKEADGNVTLYGYTESQLSPSEIGLHLDQNLDLSKKFISLSTGYLFSVADNHKIDGIQSLKGSIVLNRDHTPAGMVVDVTDDGRFQVASANSLRVELQYLTTVSDAQKRVRYAFTYLPTTEEIDYKGVRFNELSKRLVYRFGLPTKSLIDEYNRVSQLPSTPDNDAYLNMIKSLNPEEMRRQNFDTTRVAVSQGISQDNPLSGSLARILNLGEIDESAKVLVHKVNQNSIATLYDLMAVLKSDRDFPTRSTLDQSAPNTAMNISVKPLEGDEKFYITGGNGSGEKDTWNAIHSKMEDLMSDYKAWLIDYVAKNKPASYYADPYSTSTGGYSSGSGYPTTPAQPIVPKGWGISASGYQEVTFIRLKQPDRYAYGQEPVQESVTFCPEESLAYINRLMDDYFKYLIGLDNINNDTTVSEDQRNIRVRKARQDMLKILVAASQHADLIKTLHDGSNLVNSNENSIENRVLDLVRNLGDLKTSCNQDIERLNRSVDAIKRYNQ